MPMLPGGEFQVPAGDLAQYNDPTLDAYRQQRVADNKPPWYKVLLDSIMASSVTGNQNAAPMPQTNPYANPGQMTPGGYAQLGQIAGNALRRFAHGGIVTEPTVALIGEAGPEAVVPLGQDKSRYRDQILRKITRSY